MTSTPKMEILETLGEGSFGSVYVARLVDGALSRTVVLKVLKAGWAQDQNVLTRARDEAALLSRLNHDNIIRVEQLTTMAGRPAVVMEYIQGVSIDKLLGDSGPMPVSVALDVISKVCSGLDAAFNGTPPGESQPLRVIHRDIKPSNLVISVTGAVKILDFGTARGEFDEREARTQQIALGSPRYMAPECFDGAPASPQVDIYALGVTLWEMLVGRPIKRLPFLEEKHADAVHDRLEQVNPPGLTPLAVSALRNLIGRMVRYDPARRPTAKDVRRLCREYKRRLPRGLIPLDQYAEAVVEPLWRDRVVTTPDAIDGTLDASEIRRVARAASLNIQAALPPAPLGAPLGLGNVDATPELAPMELAPEDIAPMEPAPAQGDRPPAPQMDMKLLVGVALGAGLFGGLLVLVIMMLMRGG